MIFFFLEKDTENSTTYVAQINVSLFKYITKKIKKFI